MVECTGLENLRTERFREFESHLLRQIRSIAQSGSASALGAEGHRFESYYSDQLEETKMDIFGVWVIIGVNILVVAVLAPMVWDLIKNG